MLIYSITIFVWTYTAVIISPLLHPYLYEMISFKWLVRSFPPTFILQNQKQSMNNITKQIILKMYTLNQMQSPDLQMPSFIFLPLQ